MNLRKAICKAHSRNETEGDPSAPPVLRFPIRESDDQKKEPRTLDFIFAAKDTCFLALITLTAIGLSACSIVAGIATVGLGPGALMSSPAPPPIHVQTIYEIDGNRRFTITFNVVGGSCGDGILTYTDDALSITTEIQSSGAKFAFNGFFIDPTSSFLISPMTSITSKYAEEKIFTTTKSIKFSSDRGKTWITLDVPFENASFWLINSTLYTAPPSKDTFTFNARGEVIKRNTDSDHDSTMLVDLSVNPKQWNPGLPDEIPTSSSTPLSKGLSCSQPSSGAVLN